MSNPVILGATGKVGRTLARVWPPAAPRGLWQYRPGSDANIIAGFPGAAQRWDILGGAAPDLPSQTDSMIVLAGVIGHDVATLAQNTDIALAAVKAARAAGIPRVLVASTQAVYGTAADHVSEDTPCAPVAPYGQAKLAMEHALEPYSEVTCLRLGNVAGTDMLFQVAARQPVTLDQFADGSSPRRSYIGPMTLANVLLRLCDSALTLPRILNVASPGVLEMDEVLAAAGVEVTHRAAPTTTLALMEMDVSKLAALVPLEPVDAHRLIAEARAGGWRAMKDAP